MDVGTFHSLQELTMEKKPEEIENSEFGHCNGNGVIKECIDEADSPDSVSLSDKPPIRKGYGFLKV